MPKVKYIKSKFRKERPAMDEKNKEFDIELDDGEEVTQDTFKELSNGKGEEE